MSMTVIVTRDVAARFRGFLASVALEIAPGVYTSPNMSKSVRERVWDVLSDWHRNLACGSVIMTWRDTRCPGQQQVLTLGEPAKEIVDADGVLLVRKA